MLLGWAEGREGVGHPGQNSIGEGDNYPKLEVTILHRVPGRLLPQKEGARLGVLRRQPLFPWECNAPLVGFLAVGLALIRENVWDVLP